ncbi:dynamin family protein [Brachymonas sp.]|uniref:dynamin family protein n=1 Tax=Brachymonas sp. TaxID=1936292 RepID=UPI0035B0F741
MKLHRYFAPWKKSMEACIEPIEAQERALHEKQARFANDLETLNLRIGIMGQVKAGKSTFLNALLFDGKPVLPQAATPKTANLTRITWGPGYALDVEFYSAKEWADIEAAAAQADASQASKVARELVSLLQAKGVDAAQVLAAQQGAVQTHSAPDLDSLMALLNDFVGNNGRHTPLVKMTHLYLPMDELRGFDVVDTPGMNDPVLSRTIKTRQYMEQCDVVFFLSRCSQFLDQSDIDLLGQQLPDSGIKRMVLVAGQLDAVVLDDGYDRTSLQETLHNVRTRLSHRAAAEMEKLAQRRDAMAGGSAGAEPDAVGRPIATLLRSLKMPLFASTFAHGFASWPQDRWDESMRHVYAQISSLAEECWMRPDGLKTAEWEEMAGFAPLRAAYDAERSNKRATLQQQKSAMYVDVANSIDGLLNALQEEAQRRIQQLQTGDLKALQKQQDQLARRLDGIAQQLNRVTSKVLDEAHAQSRQLLNGLAQDAQEHADIQTRTGTEERTRSYQVSNSTWYKFWTWGSTRTVYSTQSISYEYLSAADAVESLSRYERSCARSIEAHFGQLINAQALKKDLRKALVDELSRQQQEFDAREFRHVLEDALEQLHIPELELPIGNAADALTSQFSGRVRSQDMDALRATLNKALQNVFERLKTVFEQQAEKLLFQLQTVRDSLQQTLSDSLQLEMARLEEEFGHKQARIDEYQSLMPVIQQAREEVETIRRTGL